jgi:ketosteroid isomerase-like protein
VNRATYLILAAPLLIAAHASSKDLSNETLKSAAPYIDKANAEWRRAIVSGEAELLSAPYERDGMFIAPNGTIVHGRKAVRSMYAARPSNVKVVRATIKSDGRAAHGPDDVYEWGTAHITLKRGKTLKETSGRYLTVWHRNGREWLISRNIAF